MFDESLFLTNDIISYEPTVNQFDKKKVKREFLLTIEEQHVKKFEEGNDLTKHDILLISTFLNPCFKADYYTDEEMEYVKGLIRSKFTNVSISHSTQMNQKTRIKRASEIDELEVYISKECLVNTSLIDIITH